MPSPAINLSDASMADTFAALVPPLVYEAASKDELEIITFVVAAIIILSFAIPLLNRRMKAKRAAQAKQAKQNSEKLPRK